MDVQFFLATALQEPPPQLAAYDVAYVPYTTRIMDDKDANGHIKPVPWNQEPEIDTWVESIVNPRASSRRHGTFVYSLGDETVTRGSDTSPSDLAAYQRYLQQQYGTIAKLNASWGTQFQGFGEVSLLDPEEPRELAAKQDGNFPRWYDRQAWECANFVKLCERFVKRFRELDPAALTGFEGAGRFDRGDDIDGIVGTNGFWSPYPGPVDRVIEGIAPREFPRANWMGYVKDSPPMIWKYWRMILNGCDSVWWWRWDGIGRFNGILRPDLSEFDAFRELWADTRLTREGLGDLLLRCERETDGIAMLYSHPSAYAAQVADGPSYGSYESAHVAWHRQLDNAGLSFRYLTDGQLKRGEFDPNSAKVLVLSRAEAIGEPEAAAIREFVNLGGTVIADLRPGLYDEHLKRRTVGALDDVFGIDSSSAASAQTSVAAELSFDPLPVGRPRRMLQADQQTIDPGLQAKAAMVLGSAGESPVLLDHACGKGRAILLNLAPEPMDGFSGDVLGRFAGQLLAAAGVTPTIELERTPGAGVPPDLRLVRWRNGADTLVAVQSQAQSGGRFGPAAPRPGPARVRAAVGQGDRPGRDSRPRLSARLGAGPGTAQRQSGRTAGGPVRTVGGTGERGQAQPRRAGRGWASGGAGDRHPARRDGRRLAAPGGGHSPGRSGGGRRAHRAERPGRRMEADCQGAVPPTRDDRVARGAVGGGHARLAPACPAGVRRGGGGRPADPCLPRPAGRGAAGDRRPARRGNLVPSTGGQWLRLVRPARTAGRPDRVRRGVGRSGALSRRPL